jgi:UDP-glucuronate 4-epimerase
MLVTGAAGFIGSHLSQRLLADGHTVVGVDCFTDYYDPTLKERHAAAVERGAGGRFELVRSDLALADLDELLAGVDVAFHQAGQPGVRLSWSDGFAAYVERNVTVTQRLLEAARRADLARFVFASSSSVYGNADRYPVDEGVVPRPHSPYGVTKLAAEHLCSLYGENWGLPTVSLRYFTVYGPRQRPDMAMHRLVEAARHQIPFPLFGDGSHVRDFTFVEDVVRANVAAADADIAPGTFVNVAGGGEARMSDVIDLVGELAGRSVPVDRQAPKAGDVARTGATTEQAHRLLGWSPTVSLREGLAAQVAWHEAELHEPAAFDD